MSPLGRNILANLGGQAATTLIALATVPLFLTLLGAEAYGLVSFLLVLQAMSAVLDFGLSTTANREVSRYIAQGRAPGERHDLVRTLELVYGGTALLLFAAFAGAAPWLATSWFEAQTIDAAALRACLFVAAATVALRWPTALYYGVLRGMERQVAVNVITGVSALLRGAGGVLVLLFIGRDVVTFFEWQLVFAVAELGLCVGAVYRRGAAFTGSGGRFRAPLLRELWRFSIRVGGLSIFALALKQLDKVIVSALLPISSLGFYNAASLASNGLTKLSGPVQAAVFPRLTQLHEHGDATAVAGTFHRSVQLTAFFAVPFGCVLMFFAPDVLWLWTRNAALVAEASMALAVLSAAMILNTLMSVPFSMLIASGHTGVPLRMNAAGAILLTPLTYVLVQRYGITGAAVSWLAFNVAYFVIVPAVMFRRILRGEHRAWLTRDTLPFILQGVAMVGLARWLSAGSSLPVRVLAAVLSVTAYLGTVILTNGMIRDAIRARMGGGRPSGLSGPAPVKS